MIGKEVEMVLNGEYKNSKLDAYMEGLLKHSLLNLNMSDYMKARELRTHVICDRYYEKLHEQNNEVGLGL